MVKFLVKLLIIVIPLGVALVWLEVRMSKVPNSFNKKKDSFLSLADSIEVINTGSSHGFYDIDPSYFSRKGFNLANSSQDLYADKELIVRNLHRLPKLKIAIVPISHFSFFVLFNNGPEPWRRPYYKRYWGFSYDKFPKELSYYSYIAMFGQQITIREIKRGFKDDLAPTVSRLGFNKVNTLDSVDLDVDSAGKSRAKALESFSSLECFEENMAYVSQMIEALQKRGVQVVLITTPALPAFYRNLTPVYYNKMQEGIARLCKKYNLSYLSYLKDSRFKKIEFHDNDHLNYFGAAHFSRILDSEIIRKAMIRN